MSILLSFLLSLASCDARWAACWELDAACARPRSHRYHAGSCAPARRCFNQWTRACGGTGER